MVLKTVSTLGATGGGGGTPGGNNTQVQYNSSGAFAGSANLTFDGTTLTAAGLSGPHNGTVGATTPAAGVFTTAKAIAAATQDSVTLQGRAGGTGSFGVTLTPTTLTASRTLTLPDASGTILQSGTTVTTAQGGTGLSSFTSGGVVYASSTSALATGSALTFDGTNLTNSQNTASPIGLVLNNVSASTSAGTRLTFKFGGSNTGYVGNQFDGSDFNNQYQANQFHIWLNGATEQMRLTSTGLGIGTTSPGVRLESRKDTNATINELLRLRNDGVGDNTGTKIGFSSGADEKAAISSFYVSGWQLAFNNNGSERMRLDSSGNLGLGVTPSVGYGKEFSISADTNSGVGGLGVRNLAASNNITYLSNNAKNTGAFTDSYWTSTIATRYQQDNGGHKWLIAPSGTAGNAITFTQAMTLTAAGKLLLGTTSAPIANSVQAVISNSSGGGLQLDQSGSGVALVPNSGSAGLQIYTYTGGVGTETYTERARIDSSGNLGIGTTSPSASAILDAQSTTKGVRMPNMTTTQKNAISSPAAGLMVFDTTLAKLCVYSGSAWQTITSV